MKKLIKNDKILQKDKTALLIIDIQERIYKVMRKHKSLVENVLKLIRGSKILNIPIFYTEQYPNGLGETIADLKGELVGEAIHKLTFSCFEAQNLFEQLKVQQIEQIIVCGVESHVCVLQTVLDLLYNDFQVNIAVDAMSSREKIDYQTAIRRMEKKGAELCTVESILFELLHICGTPEFKKISTLIK